jgi:hypothetical protein
MRSIDDAISFLMSHDLMKAITAALFSMEELVTK